MSKDTISRQAAIDALKDVSEHYTDKGREWHPHVDFMVEAIQDLPSAQQWIPVTERLPEEGWCLCTVHGVFYDYCEILLYQKRKRKMRFFRLDDDGEYVDFTDLVTAWMPLPTPWRGEEDV